MTMTILLSVLVLYLGSFRSLTLVLVILCCSSSKETHKVTWRDHIMCLWKDGARDMVYTFSWPWPLVPSWALGSQGISPISGSVTEGWHPSEQRNLPQS